MNATPLDSNSEQTDAATIGAVTLDARCQARLRSLHPGPLREDTALSDAGQIIGRDADQVDLIHTGPDVSRQHAWIGRNDLDQWEIRDLSSLNGTFLNGRVIDRAAVLQSGDVIGLGRSRAPDYEFALAGAAHERLIRLSDDGPWVVGRALESDLSIPADLSVSQRHARIERRGDRLRIADKGSRNGLWQGQQRRRQLTLEPNDAFMIGHHRIRWLNSDDGELILAITSLGQAIGLRLDGWSPIDAPESKAVEVAPGQLHQLMIADATARTRLMQRLGRDHLIDGACFSQDWLGDQIARQRDRVALVDALDPLPEALTLRRWLGDEAILRVGTEVSVSEREALIQTSLQAVGLTDGLSDNLIADLSALNQALARLAAALLTRPGLIVINVNRLDLDDNDRRQGLNRLKKLAGAELTLVILSAQTGMALQPNSSRPSAPTPAQRHLRRPSRGVLSCLIRRGLHALVKQPSALAGLLALPALLVLVMVHWLAMRSGVIAAQTALLISAPLAAVALTPTRDALPRGLIHRFGLLPDHAIAQALMAAATVAMQFLIVLGLTTVLLPLDVWSIGSGLEVLLAGAVGMGLGLLIRSASRGQTQLALLLVFLAGTGQAAWVLNHQPMAWLLLALTLFWSGLVLTLGARWQQR